MSIFSDRLAEAIRMRGVTQAWVADKANTTEATISRYTNQQNAPVAIVLLSQIAGALNVSSDFLVGRTNIPDVKPSLPPDKKILLDCYSKLSPQDAMVLWALLDRYMSPQEREQVKRSAERDEALVG